MNGQQSTRRTFVWGFAHDVSSPIIERLEEMKVIHVKMWIATPSLTSNRNCLNIGSFLSADFVSTYKNILRYYTKNHCCPAKAKKIVQKIQFCVIRILHNALTQKENLDYVAF